MAATSNEPVILLKTAVSHLTDYINNHDLSPQDALQKVSEEFDLSPNFIKRASEAINVALTHSHFKKHAESRDAEFPITDADKVVGNIFGEAVKTASEKEINDVRVGGNAESFRINTYKLANPKYKVAYAQILNASNEEQKLSDKGIFAKSAAVLDTLEKVASEAHADSVDAEFKMKVAFAELVNDLSKDQHNHQTFEDFSKQACAEVGPQAVPFLVLMHKAAGLKDAAPVAPTHQLVNYTPTRQVEKLSQLIDLCDSVGKLTKKASEAKAEYQFHKDHVAETFQEIGRAKLGALYASGQLTLLEEIAAEKKAEDAVEKAEESEEKKDKPQVDPVAVEVKRVEKIAEESKNLFHTLAKGVDFGKKTHGADSAQLDNAKRQHILTELLTTDPILSEQDPHHMAQAYLQMIQLSPELSLQKEVVRGQLRQMAAGQALNPHDASLLSGANNEILKTTQMRTPQQPHNPQQEKK